MGSYVGHSPDHRTESLRWLFCSLLESTTAKRSGKSLSTYDYGLIIFCMWAKTDSAKSFKSTTKINWIKNDENCGDCEGQVDRSVRGMPYTFTLRSKPSPAECSFTSLFRSTRSRWTARAQTTKWYILSARFEATWNYTHTHIYIYTKRNRDSLAWRNVIFPCCINS